MTPGTALHRFGWQSSGIVNLYFGSMNGFLKQVIIELGMSFCPTEDPRLSTAYGEIRVSRLTLKSHTTLTRNNPRFRYKTGYRNRKQLQVGRIWSDLVKNSINGHNQRLWQSGIFHWTWRHKTQKWVDLVMEWLHPWISFLYKTRNSAERFLTGFSRPWINWFVSKPWDEQYIPLTRLPVRF